MKIINISKNNIQQIKPFAVALGYFDGLHIGHQKIVKEVLKRANENNIKSAVFTFSSSPKDTIAGNNKPTNIAGISEAKIKLKKLGVNYLIVMDATKKDLTSITAQDFINNYLKAMGAKVIVCGTDFKFGKNKSGKAANIEKISKGEIKTHIISLLKKDGMKISSRSIKQYLRNNELSKANIMLGRDFAVVGKVMKGKQIGRQLGFKTANIKLHDIFSLELNGVFAVEIHHKNEVFQGIANIGFAPTLQTLVEKQLEIYLFDFNEDIYNKVIEVKFKKFIREEKKFDSPTQLVNQIKQDIKKVKTFFMKQ